MPDYQFHPLANLFPLMEGEEFQALCDSLRAHSMQKPIILDAETGMILDGRNRYNASLQTKTMRFYETRTFASDEERLAYVLDANLHRRHLNESQRALVAARVKTTEGKGRPAKNAPIGAITQPQAAAKLNISRRAVQRAETVDARGTPELVHTVENGSVPISVAEKVARMPPERQARFVSAVQTSVKPPHQIVAQLKREDRRVEVIAKSARLPTLQSLGRRFQVAYADPPWEYEQQQMGHTDRGVENHYPTMKLEQICALPVAEITALDAILFLWATMPCLKEALHTMEAWGFEYKPGFVWIKDNMGMGYRVRNRHELLLIGVRGELPLPDEANRPDSVIMGGQGEHSAKPLEAYERIERMYPEFDKIELFARNRREGWHAWGMESPELIAESLSQTETDSGPAHLKQFFR